MRISNSSVTLVLLTLLPLLNAIHMPTKSAPDDLIPSMILHSRSMSTRPFVLPTASHAKRSENISRKKPSIGKKPSWMDASPEPDDEDSESMPSREPHHNDSDSMGYQNYTDGMEYHADGEDYDYHYYKWWYCDAPQNPERTVTFAGDYSGSRENLLYIDSTYGLFKLGLGYNEKQIYESKMETLTHFKEHFGIHVNLSTFKKHPEGLYYRQSPNGAPEDDDQMDLFAPVIFNVTFRVVADSWYSTDCASTTALLGGWVLSANNVTVNGTLGGETGIKYKGNSLFMVLYMIVAPGTRHSTRLMYYPIYPVNCERDGACALSGVVYSKDDYAHGWMDGSMYGTDEGMN